MLHKRKPYLTSNLYTEWQQGKMLRTTFAGPYLYRLHGLATSTCRVMSNSRNRCKCKMLHLDKAATIARRVSVPIWDVQPTQSVPLLRPVWFGCDSVEFLHTSEVVCLYVCMCMCKFGSKMRYWCLAINIYIYIYENGILATPDNWKTGI